MEHRTKDCKAGKAESKAPDQKPSTQAASSSTSSGQMEAFMQQAVPALRQLEANPPRSDTTRMPSHLNLGRKAWNTSQQPSVPPAAPASSPPFGEKARYSIAIRSGLPNRDSPKSQIPPSGGPVGKAQESEFGKPQWGVALGPPKTVAYTVLSSGATHAMRQAVDEEIPPPQCGSHPQALCPCLPTGMAQCSQ